MAPRPIATSILPPWRLCAGGQEGACRRTHQRLWRSHAQSTRPGRELCTRPARQRRPTTLLDRGRCGPRDRAVCRGHPRCGGPPGRAGPLARSQRPCQRSGGSFPDARLVLHVCRRRGAAAQRQLSRPARKARQRALHLGANAAHALERHGQRRLQRRAGPTCAAFQRQDLQGPCARGLCAALDQAPDPHPAASGQGRLEVGRARHLWHPAGARPQPRRAPRLCGAPGAAHRDRAPAPAMGRHPSRRPAAGQRGRRPAAPCACWTRLAAAATFCT